MLDMLRLNLITKEKAKKAYKGELKNDPIWGNYEGSINDDLERFLINLQNQEEVKYEVVRSFFTPKLTNEELKLVQDRNEEHFKTYRYNLIGRNPDVGEVEMNESDSKSKFVHGACYRQTIPLKLQNKKSRIRIKNVFIFLSLFLLFSEERNT